jgi:hypothetical protein
MNDMEMSKSQIKALCALLNKAIADFTLGYNLAYKTNEFKGHSDQSFYEVLIMSLKDSYNYYKERLEEIEKIKKTSDDIFRDALSRKLAA